MDEYIVIVEADESDQHNIAVGDIRKCKKIIHCRDCDCWSTVFGMVGYCSEWGHHRHISGGWDIDISRKTRPDFFCAGAKPREDDEDDEDE